jgi:prepilin-type N-terminal cleavage/methylation domain-containing protein
MGHVRKEENGFTLVELLMVVMLLGILAAIVIVNIVGLVGRGERESFELDERTIQTAVSAFYADTHAYSHVNGWNEATGNGTFFHGYPTASGRYSSLYRGDWTEVNGYNVCVVMDSSDGAPATANDIVAAAIWMGMLCNAPGDGDITGAGPDVAPGDANSPLRDEHGPYLNPLPRSCSQNNNSGGSGTTTWIVGEYGRVYGVFEQDGVWYAGFGGRYP